MELDAAEDRRKHLELLQGAITRMAGNSFVLKGWTVTIVAALFALAVDDSRARYAALALLPAVAFWALDAYYLRQERLFRTLYDAVRTGAPSVQSYSMDTSPFRHAVGSVGDTLLSPTVVALHGSILIVIGVVATTLKELRGW